MTHSRAQGCLCRGRTRCCGLRRRTRRGLNGIAYFASLTACPGRTPSICRAHRQTATPATLMFRVPLAGRDPDGFTAHVTEPGPGRTVITVLRHTVNDASAASLARTVHQFW